MQKVYKDHFLAFTSKKMVKINQFYIICIFIIFLTLVSISLASAEFNFAGYTKYQNGTNMSNANISLRVTYWDGDGPPTTITTLSNLSDSNGFFNLTINDTYDNSSYQYLPSIIRYNGTAGTGAYAEYIGQSLPSFDGRMFSDLGAITFYLKQAINIDLSVVGNTHSGSELVYSNSLSLGADYGTGFDVVNESQLYNLVGNNRTLTYSYINDSDCLVILNSSRALNLTFCDLNITNIVDLERYNWGQSVLNQNNSYYFANNSHLMQCYTDNDRTMRCTNSVALPAAINYTAISGIGIGAKNSQYTYLYVSGVNSSGSHIVGKFYPNLTYVNSYSISYGGAGKISTSNGYGNLYFATNNSGLYQLYYCYLAGQDNEANVECGPDSTFANFTEGEIVTGISNFGNQLTYASSVSKNMTYISTDTEDYQFMYQVKDTRLGYSVKQEWNSPLDSVGFSLPAGRNYSLMIYPSNGPAFPATLDLNNLEAGNNISLGNRNATITSVGGGLYVNFSNANLSLEFAQLPGYIKWNNSITEQNFTNLTVLAYLLEGGNMVYKGGTLPNNMGARWKGGDEAVYDSFNLTTGRYNMSLPASVLGANLLLFATGYVNNSGTLVYYGGFKSVTLRYGESAAETNFTLYPLIGQESNITIGYETQSDASKFLTKQKSFSITANGSAVSQAHVEVELDYSSFSGSNLSFSWMAPVSSGDAGIFKIPVFNSTIKSIQVFSSNYAPLKKKISQSDLQQDIVYINLSEFENKNPDGEAINDSIIDLMIYINKDDGSCSVPYPDASCYPFDPESEEEINPFGLVLGGGKLDFEIKKIDNNITVRYINVDLLASGPPDAVFDEAANSSEGGLEEAWRFGSLGPEIYDYVLIGIPYNTTAITSSFNAVINITKFYGESWSAPEWEMGVNGTGALDGTDYEDYTGTDYDNYTDGSGALCSTDDSDLSESLCYRNVSDGMLWFKIPHFSGIGPEIVGAAIDEGDDSGDDSGGGGGDDSGGIIGFWTLTSAITPSQFSSGHAINLSAHTRASVNISNALHHVGVISVTNTTATINISSNPIQATLNLGEEKKFDIDGNNNYDISIKLLGITSGSASLLIQQASGIVNPVANCTDSCTSKGYNCGTFTICGTSVNCGSCSSGSCQSGICVAEETNPDVEKEGVSLKTLILIAILVIIIIIIIILLVRSRSKSRYYHKGW
jgi:hypothetical protein